MLRFLIRTQLSPFVLAAQTYPWTLRLILVGLLTHWSFSSAEPKSNVDLGPQFGPEFSFPLNLGDKSHQLYIDHLRQHLVEGQPEGSKFSEHYKEASTDAVFTSPNGWWFEAGRDKGVIEVRMKPLRVDEAQIYASDIQDAIFASAYHLEFYPGLFVGGGHINIDLSYFFDNPVLLRNFIVDFVNHNELSLGIFNYDTHNASPIIFSGTYLALNQVLKDFDQRLLMFQNHPIDFKKNVIKEFLLKLNLALVSSSRNAEVAWETLQFTNRKLTAISFDEAISNGNSARIEIRSVRPQWSFDMWIRQISLLRDRIFYLKKTFPGVLIPLQPRVPLLILENKADIKLKPPIDPQLALESFYKYVTEAGQVWSDHRDYIWPSWMWKQEGQSRSELERFESSRWFKTQEAFNRTRRMNSCLQVLK